MLVCLVSFAIAVSHADSTTKVVPIDQLVSTTWTRKDGAPIGIRDLAQTTDGLLWIGSDSGLTRLDGSRFVRFQPQHGDTLARTGVRDLAPARDGGLWIVWRNGQVSRLRDGQLITFGERDGLSNAFQVAESSIGVIVAGTANGIARFTNGQWKDVSREWGYPDTEGVAVWFDRGGTLWAESEARVLYLPAGEFSLCRSADAARVSTRGPSRLRGSARWERLDGGARAIGAHGSANCRRDRRH